MHTAGSCQTAVAAARTRGASPGAWPAAEFDQQVLGRLLLPLPHQRPGAPGVGRRSADPPRRRVDLRPALAGAGLEFDLDPAAAVAARAEASDADVGADDLGLVRRRDRFGVGRVELDA